MTCADRVNAADALRIAAAFSSAAGSKGQQNGNNVMALFAPQKSQARAVSVDVSFCRAPQPNRVPLYVELPNPIYADAKICLITPAPQRKYKEELQEAQADDAVTKVMDVTKLEAKYSNPVARRALAKAFDVFFVHSDVETYPKLLTGEFLSRQTPVWMSTRPGTLVEKIAVTKRIAVCPRRGYDNVSVVFGHAAMSADELEANLNAVVDGIVASLESGWKDILSLRVSTANAAGQRVALPVYAHDFAESAGFPAAAAPSTTAAASPASKVAPAPTPASGKKRGR